MSATDERFERIERVLKRVLKRAVNLTDIYLEIDDIYREYPHVTDGKTKPHTKPNA